MAGVWVFSSRPAAAAWVAVIWFKASTVSMFQFLSIRWVVGSGTRRDRRVFLLEQLPRGVVGEQLEAVLGDEHGRLQGGVLATAAALCGLGELQLVSDLHLMALADLADIEGHFHLAFLAVVNHGTGDGAQGLAELVGEHASVEIGDEFAGVGSFHVVAPWGYAASAALVLPGTSCW